MAASRLIIITLKQCIISFEFIVSEFSTRREKGTKYCYVARHGANIYAERCNLCFPTYTIQLYFTLIGYVTLHSLQQ